MTRLFHRLLQPLQLRGRASPTRVMFGPHVTNLCRRNCLTGEHAAWYAARASGGAGLVVLEQASVHASDQPYEMCPSFWAEGFEESLFSVAQAVHRAGALVIASLGHAGGQATGALSRGAVLAPSPFPEVASREMSKAAEPDEITEIVSGFQLASAMAARAELDGVEINAGQYSLIRQFLSPLTNQRSDSYGGDGEARARFAREVIAAVRAGLGGDRILGLRLSVDEFAPWAGITPDLGFDIARQLGACVEIDYLVVTRGGPYTANRTQPGAFIPDPRDDALTSRIRAALPRRVAVFAQGGIADVEVAEHLLESGVADGVEMTRALIADENLVVRLRAGQRDLIRPCLLCNEDCQVRDSANHIVSCIHNPRAGHESEAEFAGAVSVRPRQRVLVVGSGPAGLEAAMVAASLGHSVEVWEAAEEPGGAVRFIAASPTRELYAAAVGWRVARLRSLGVEIRTRTRASLDDLLASDADRIIIATGGRTRDPRPRGVDLTDDGLPIFTHRDVLSREWPAALRVALTGPGPAVVYDLIDDFWGPSAAEVIAARRPSAAVYLVTPQRFIGSAFLAPGALPGLRQRLHAAGVELWPQRDLIRGAGRTLVFRRHWRIEEASIDGVSALIVCDREEPEDGLYRAALAAGLPVECVGDAVAPRRIIDAVLEGGRAARRLGSPRGSAASSPVDSPRAMGL